MPATRTLGPIDVALLLIGSQSPSPVHLVAHLRNASSLKVNVHLVTDFHRADAPGEWSQYLVDSLAPEYRSMHAEFARLAGGRENVPKGGIFMFKPLLHRILPLERALVLDSDIVLPASSDLADLWAEFDAMETASPVAAIGLAWEQQPSADPNGPSPFRTFRSGWMFNGGVQLLHLGRMRSGGVYERELRACASGGCGRFDYLGDQVFYTAVHERTPALFHVLPCGWNRQLRHNLFPYDPFRFLRYHTVCQDRCRLIHGNQEDFKLVVTAIQTRIGAGCSLHEGAGPSTGCRVTCDTCRAAVTAEFGERSAADDATGAAAQNGSAYAVRTLLGCCGCDVDGGADVEGARRAEVRRRALRGAERGGFVLGAAGGR